MRELAKDDHRVVVRQRIDWRSEDGKMHSLIHKVWDGGTVEYYGLDQWDRPPRYKDESGPTVIDTSWRDVTQEEWESRAKTNPPQTTYANSEWGDGLPGAGDLWGDNLAP